MRFVSDIAVGLACLSAALAISYYIWKRRSVTGVARQASVTAIIGFIAFGASRLVDVGSTFSPGHVWLEFVQALTLGVALTASLAIWGLLPGLLAAPSQDELLEANKALSGAAERRAEELIQLAAAKAQLEQAVAERTQELDEANQRFENALKNSDISLAQQDCDLRYVWVHNAPKGMAAASLLGRLQSDALPIEADRILAAAKRGVMAQKQAASIDLPLEINGVTRYFHENIEPLWRKNEVVGVVTTCIETTSYRRQQEELRGLLRELTHRTKNLLAVIMGIARQSGRSSTDVATFVMRFNGRIRALASAHELLVESDWRGVGLRNLIAGVWKATSQEAEDKLTLIGTDYPLTPECAQNLALAIYEMQNNAIDHGGLLGPDGAVKIIWTAAKDEPGQGLKIVWEETGRPSSPASVQGDGFGKSFVEVLLPRATRGRSSVELHDHGLTWTLTLPQSNFIADAAQSLTA